jgi:hypothetical protein
MSSRIREEVLHMLCIRGRITPAQLADGLDSQELSSPLTELEADGLVRNSGNARFPWSITEEGRQLAETRITGISAAAKTRCAGHYERFQELNEQLKQLCADWQSRDPGTTTDFGSRLALVDDAAQELLRPVVEIAPAFAMYGRRLARARDRFTGGSDNYLTGILVDSYHTVWFELHECFFITLGRSRLAEEIPRPSRPTA